MNSQTATDEHIAIKKTQVSAYTIPTATPESDGTLQWNSTTLVLVELSAGAVTGIGYTYANVATASFINNTLFKLVEGKSPFDIPFIHELLCREARNDGNKGIAAMAISAVDNALWDLKAKLIDIPLCRLLGQAMDKMLIYGSGGFTSYSQKQLEEQLGGWAGEGIHFLKMKIGREPDKDVERVTWVRNAIGASDELFVDANGAYTVKQSIQQTKLFQSLGVTWFEEPVSSDNLEGLKRIRKHTQINIAAGEYGYDLPYFERMLALGAVDILQADATRCGGISTFVKAGNICEAWQVPFSSHSAPALHLHAALAIPSFYISEYFFDHTRIESMLFDGVSPPRDGYLFPDLSRPGLGLEFKKQDAKKFQV